MASYGTEFVGLTDAQYDQLIHSGIAAIIDFLDGNATPITVEGSNYWVLNVDELEFISLLEEYELIDSIDVLYFSYLKSTWSMSGFGG